MTMIGDIKPPRLHLQWGKSLPQNRMLANEAAINEILTTGKSSGDLSNCRITDLRQFLIELDNERIKRKSKKKWFSFYNSIFDNADLKELNVQNLDLYFQHCYFLDNLDIRRAKFNRFSIAGDYIHNIFAIEELNDEANIGFGGLQIDLLHISKLKLRSLHIDQNVVYNVTITDCSFDNLTIQESSYMGPTFLENLDIKNSLNISETEFDNHLYMKNITGLKKFELLNSICNREVTTYNLKCEEVSFAGTKFNRNSDLNGLNFNSLDLRQTVCDGRLLLNIAQIIRATSSLRSSFDVPSKIFGDGSKDKGELNDAATQILSLRENFHKIPGKIQEEDYCSYRLMECSRSLSDSKGSRLFYFLYKNLFGYTVLPERIIATIFSVILFFSLAYFCSNWLNFGEILQYDARTGEYLTVFRNGMPVAFFRCFYFSVITFTTVGYGDVHPTEIFKILAMVEGLLGVFLMTIFMVSIARKILRW